MPYPFVVVSNIPLVKKNTAQDLTIADLPYLFKSYASFERAKINAEKIARENSGGCAAVYKFEGGHVLYRTDTPDLTHTLNIGDILLFDLGYAGGAFFEVVGLVGNNAVTIKQLKSAKTPTDEFKQQGTVTPLKGEYKTTNPSMNGTYKAKEVSICLRYNSKGYWQAIASLWRHQTVHFYPD